MVILLKQIEVENFKSYRGKWVIPFVNGFNMVIGPNGVGKSNLMDAICFVMGERSQNLRMKRMSQLIHGAVVGKPISDSVSVTATFYIDEKTEMVFQRLIHGSSSEFKIDGKGVSYHEYLSMLAALKVNIRAKNFLIFQGEVESLALKDPKEITKLFEEISGSGALKEEYTRLYFEMNRAQEDVNCIFQHKKLINSDKQAANYQIKECQKYASLEEELKKIQVEYYLFRLFHNLGGRLDLERELMKKQATVLEMEEEKEQLQNFLKEKKKDQGKCRRELAKIEQCIREVDVEIFKRQPEFLVAKEAVSHVQKKLDRAVITLDQAMRADDAHLIEIQKLTDELANVEQMKRKYKHSKEYQILKRTIELDDAQEQEYKRLKELAEAAKYSTTYIPKLDSLDRDQKADQDRLDNIRRMKKETDNYYEQKLHEVEDTEKRVIQLEEYIRVNKISLKDQKQLMEGLQSVASAKSRVQEIQKELEVIVEQLGNAKVDNHEYERLAKKQQVVEYFKNNYAGVHGRIINICKPINNSYNVAVTKVLGSNIDAIVVDKEHTACLCIKYLKEQKLDRETFLPLDSIRPKDISDQLKDILQSMGVELIVDILKFDHAIHSAVQFATNNAVVCETTDVAVAVAYELGTRLNAVTMDGTYYKKSGIISGGNLDLAKKAKQWNKKDILKLRAQKEKLMEELRECTKDLRKEFELNTVKSEVQGLETRLQFTRKDVKNTEKQIAKMKKELAKLTAESDNYSSQIESIENDMKIRQEQIDVMQLKVDQAENKVFLAFCTKLGIDNIKQYEKGAHGAREEKKKKLFEFDTQINRIRSLLVFENNRDTAGKVDLWKKTVYDEEKLLRAGERYLQEKEDEISRYRLQAKQFKEQLVAKKEEERALELEVNKTQLDIEALANKLQTALMSVNTLTAQIEAKKSERHAILRQCMIEDVVIPMVHETVKRAILPDSSDSNSSIDESPTDLLYQKEDNMVIDFFDLDIKLQFIQSDQEKKKVEKQLWTKVDDKKYYLSQIDKPDMKAKDKLKDINKKLRAINAELKEARERSVAARDAFELTKLRRIKDFNECFDRISSQIDAIYKTLTGNDSAQAFLTVDNAEEPYLEGIRYDCVAPGKRFQRMDSLSGGEKAIAALTLLFAIHTFQPSPFLVLDEIDVALDKANLRRLLSYFKQHREPLQKICISHCEAFFENSDFLIGIHPSLNVERGAICMESEIVTLNLAKYEE